jgi:hypothetical protein
MLEAVKTTIDIPDDLFRLAKAHAAMSGISLRQFVTDTLRLKLEQDQGRGRPADPPWMKGFGALAELRSETARIQRLVDAEFEQIETEP